MKFVYDPKDKLSNEEKNIIIDGLDELKSEIEKLRKGQEIIYDDFVDEIEELKSLINVLGKKNFSQIVKGKLIDIGYYF